MNYALLDVIAREKRDKDYCRGQVSLALKRGTLKKEECACGNPKVEAHHADYKRPLDVIWVCKKHHVELDKLRREQNPDFVLGHDINGSYLTHKGVVQ